MAPEFTLFLTAFTTLLALINPLEALSVFLSLTAGQDAKQRQSVALRSCMYTLMLMFFFLIFGTVILKIFGVSLSMVRIAGGLILIKIGFGLFSDPGASLPGGAKGTSDVPADIAFVPFAMPIMLGPGGIATIIGMTSLVKHAHSVLWSFVAIASAIILTVAITYLCLFRAENILKRVGATGVDAVTRIIGFFVSTMGVSLLFDGIIESLQTFGVHGLIAQ
jgi:multiple antibiotic resistance protein